MADPKRLIDVVMSATGLILLSPLMAIIALAVIIEDGRPVIFKQSRVGLHGVDFTLLKFRSMRAVRDEAGPMITAGGDRRLTRTGRFLRRTKLDELPQLWNVLRGDMSVVGPRPEVRTYIERYEPWQRDIMLSVRPGITDYAAIELRDEESILAGFPDVENAYVTILMPRKFELYRRYVNQRSLIEDIRIIVRTLIAIVAR